MSLILDTRSPGCVSREDCAEGATSGVYRRKNYHRSDSEAARAAARRYNEHGGFFIDANGISVLKRVDTVMTNGAQSMEKNGTLSETSRSQISLNNSRHNPSIAALYPVPFCLKCNAAGFGNALQTARLKLLQMPWVYRSKGTLLTVTVLFVSSCQKLVNSAQV